MPGCTLSQLKLCGECDICFSRSFSSYDGLTEAGNLKVDCWSDDNELTPREVFKGTAKKFYFDCDVCSHTFIGRPHDITSLKPQWCPYCSNHKLCKEKCHICYEKSFLSFKGTTKTGKLKTDCWSEKNKKKPIEVFRGSKSKFFFECDICSHVFDHVIHSVSGKNSCWCPYCANKKLCNDECDYCYKNSLISFEGYTELGRFKMECWSGKNKKYPRKIFKGSHTKAVFDCDICSHEFEIAIHNLVGKNRWCPYCSKPPKKICKTECSHCFQNSFASFTEKTVSGKLKLDCWSDDNELTPREVFKGTAKKFYFDCDVCFHVFESALYSITSKELCWCPQCKNKTETKFKYYFEEKYPQYRLTYQAKYKWCKNEGTNRELPFDFSVKELRLIVEIDGEHHFTQIRNWGNPDDNQDRDVYKMKRAMKNGYSIIRFLQRDVMFDRNDWRKSLDSVLTLHEKPVVYFIGSQNRYGPVKKKLSYQ